MLVGRVIHGSGGESLCVAASTLLSVYFAGKETALALGLNLSLARLGSSLNDIVTPRVNDAESIPVAIFTGVILLCFCFIATLGMVFVEKYMEKKKRKVKLQHLRAPSYFSFFFFPFFSFFEVCFYRKVMKYHQ